MKKIIASAIYFLLEILFYFGSSFVIITQQITRFIIAILHIVSNLFWLTIYGTPAVIIIALTSLIFAIKWLDKAVKTGFSLTTLQRTISFSSK